MRRHVISMGVVSVLLLMLTALPGLAGPPDQRDGTAELGTTSVAVQRVVVPSFRLGEEAAMLLVGSALIALAAALRRAA